LQVFVNVADQDMA